MVEVSTVTDALSKKRDADDLFGSAIYLTTSKFCRNHFDGYQKLRAPIKISSLGAVFHGYQAVNLKGRLKIIERLGTISYGAQTKF